MAEQWRVIDLCGFEGELRSRRGGVEVCPGEGMPTTIPVAEVAVILVGMRVALSAAVLHRLAEADVAVLFCDWRGIPEGGCYSWSDHGRVAARHRAQAEVSLPRKKNAWARLVRAKIEGQASVLENLKIRGSGELLALARPRKGCRASTGSRPTDRCECLFGLRVLSVARAPDARCSDGGTGARTRSLSPRPRQRLRPCRRFDRAV